MEVELKSLSVGVHSHVECRDDNWTQARWVSAKKYSQWVG